MNLKSVLLFLLLGVSTVVPGLANEPEQGAMKSTWGHVSGQVVLEGKSNDPLLKKYFEDLPLAQPLRLKTPPGTEPEFVNAIPNETLIIDAKSRGIKNALVYLKVKPAAIHSDYTTQPLPEINLTLFNRQFIPKVLSLQVGQTLVMAADETNGEPTNFHADLNKNNNFNVLVQAQGPAHRWIPNQPESLPVRIQSNIYPTAWAYVVLKDHPYLAVTDKDGKFELKNLPAGKHELIIWHETVGYVAKNLMVEVKPNETQTIPQKAITIEQLTK